MLQVKNLTFDFPKTRVLRNINFNVPLGAVIGLVGPNGAGKTTLLRCLSALETPLYGDVTFNGADLIENPRYTHSVVGFLQDSFGLFEELTARQCLTYFCSAHKIHPQNWSKVIEEACSLLEMQSFLDKKVETLSLGQRQRVAIGQSILHRPSLLLLDEPATGLDPHARQILSKMIRKLSDEGITLIVSSHILSELQEYSSHMLIMEKGQLVDFTDLSDEKAQIRTRRLEVQLLGKEGAFKSFLEEQEACSEIQMHQGKVEFLFAGAEQDQSSLLSELIQQGFPVSSFKVIEQSLQDRYLDRLKSSGE